MQGNPQLPNTPPLPGTTGIPLMNEAFQTIATDFSGSSDPAALAWPYCRWADTGTGRWRIRNAAGTAWVDAGPLVAEASTPVDGALLASQAWVRARALPKFAQSAVPTSDIGDIWVQGIGACRWNSTDSKYYRIPLYNNRQLITASGSFTPDAFTKTGRVTLIGGGGAGGASAAPGAASVSGSGAGGSPGSIIFQQIVTLTPGAAMPVVIGAGGVGSASGSLPGENTTFAGLTANGGSRGGDASGQVGGLPIGFGSGSSQNGGASSTFLPAPGGVGGSSYFGPGGSGGGGNAGGATAPTTSYGAGGGGAGASGASQPARAGGNGAAGALLIEW